MENLINLNRTFVTKQDILNEIGEINVFKHYTNSKIELGNVIVSPLRNEKNASFGFFSKNNEILFNDFVLGGGDCVKFVMIMFNLTWFEALSKIAIDFRIDENYIVKYNIKTQSHKVKPDFNFEDKGNLLEHHNKVLIRVKSKNWTLRDFYWWNNFGITDNILKQYDVTPVDYIFLNDRAYKADNLAYSFKETKDNITTYKIYQPFNSKYKWINNHNNSIWQGWSQLPETGENLIITKSLKDVMSITSVLNIPAVSLQAETAKPKDSVVKELKERFNNIFVLYDNDYDAEINWGRKFGKELAKTYSFVRIEIPDKFQCKDFSDLVKKYKTDRAKEIWDNYIFLPF